MRSTLLIIFTLSITVQIAQFAQAQTAVGMEKQIADNEFKIKKLEAEQQRLLQEAKKSVKLRDPEQQKIADRAEQIIREIEAQSHPLKITPSTKFSSPVAQEYINTISKKIEDCGTEHFPVKNKKKLYGKGIFMLRFDRAGILNDNQVLLSSKNKELDRYLLKIVKASGPFGPAPQELHEGIYKDFEVYSAFNFTRENQPGTQGTEIKYHCPWKN
ncbi:hypothetical protein [Undibacterium sp. Tian12W]|uniref:hypothetical protein n=1 Tax=Undibacterium sp. Tian12W TaxID=3413054 RepID=UPI003BF167C8